jgi:thiamine biosynthesis lipoprotein
MKKILAGILLLAFILGTFLYTKNIKKEYSKNFFYMDTVISVKIRTNKTNIDSIFNGVDEIYSKYQKLTDYYDNESTLYYINNNTSSDEVLTIDSNLYEMLELSNTWNKKSNGKFNINLGKVLEVWNKARDNNTVPSISSLNGAKKSINDIILLGDNKIKNNNPSIDLGAISKGYTSEKVSKYLEKNNINDYIINAGGNVIVGTPSNKDKYSIGIKDPENTNSLFKTVYGKNISIVTSGSYERFYIYEDTKYSHIIDPDTLYPANNFESVTVIADSSTIADILSTTLFVLPLEDGLKLVEEMPNVEAIYYISKDNIVTSKGFSKYE